VRYALAVVLALALAAPAQALPLLDEGDAAELAQSLAEATAEQGVCYGWNVHVDDDSGGPSGDDVGSNLGPGTPVESGSCEKTVLLEGFVSFTCGSCESEDSASWRILTDVPGVSAGDLEDLGFGGGVLKDDDGDAKLASMVGALPLIVGSKGAAPALEADPVDTSTVPASDKATNSPAIPDWLRDSWLKLAGLLIVVTGGAIWFVQAREQERRAARRAARRARPIAPVAPPAPAPAPPPPPQPRPPQE